MKSCVRLLLSQSTIGRRGSLLKVKLARRSQSNWELDAFLKEGDGCLLDLKVRFKEAECLKKY